MIPGLARRPLRPLGSGARELALLGLLAIGCQGPRASASAQGEPLTAPTGSGTVFPAASASDPLAASSDAGPAGAIEDAGSDADRLAATDAGEDAGEAGDAGKTAEEGDAGATITSGCYEQKAQAFLMRSNYWPTGSHPQEHHAALAYRVKTYGTIGKFTPKGLKGGPAAEEMAQTAVFFGISVQLHKKIIPALRCVEQELRKTCKTPSYTPQVLAGWRGRNTYRGGEVTNHLFGIALDIDPHRNACCHCVSPWNKDPHCKDRKAPPEKHMEMPVCWVESFERFGFYWLGHDKLEDTMHFEFLGDPDAITPTQGKSPRGG